jgi:hypothetical protein
MSRPAWPASGSAAKMFDPDKNGTLDAEELNSRARRALLRSLR